MHAWGACDPSSILGSPTSKFFAKLNGIRVSTPNAVTGAVHNLIHRGGYSGLYGIRFSKK